MTAVTQPIGTVTMVFTDIEGSTRLLEELGSDAYRTALTKHRRVVTEACRCCSGYQVDYEGDSFFYVFQSAQNAVQAVREVMAGLASGPIRIRVGIHTGEPELDPPKYLGLEVHRAARIMSAAHGGQVVLSRASRELVDAEAIDLGEHRLKDLSAPVWLYQLGTATFPPLRSLNNTNLPVPASSFLGRRAELEEAGSLLAETRLLTVTGAGGTGKTRFAIELASQQFPRFANGVFWVDLASIRDPPLVRDTIAHVVGTRRTLEEDIGDRAILLLLDNLEQVIDCAADLSRLLVSCPHLSLLVTSRELLQIRGERRYELPPLETAEATALFCERAQTAPTDEIAELCARLDNLPLAIELAAARARALTPNALLDRLGGRLDLLKAGRDAESRHQTLRTTIDWSYNLLAREEQLLFAQLAAFPGGCTLETAEAVCAADLDSLQSLLDKSLVRRAGDRYSMLETIRDYAVERLGLLPGREELLGRQAAWLAALAREAQPALEGRSDQAVWLTRLTDELENIRSVLAWSRSSEPGSMIELTCSLGLFFWRRGHLAEGLEWIDTALANADAERPALRAEALVVSAWLLTYLGELDSAGERAMLAATLYGELGDDRGRARALREQAKAVIVVDPAAARPLLEESARISRAVRDDWNLAIVTNNLGDVALYQGDFERALGLCGESLRLREERGDDWGSAFAGFNVGLSLLALERFVDARDQLRRTLGLAAGIDLGDIVPEAFVALAACALEVGTAASAARLLGAAEAAAAQTEAQSHPFEAELATRTTRAAQARLARTVYDDAWTTGHTATRADSVAFALGEE